MQSYCERCRRPSRIVGGKIRTVTTSRPSANGELIIETVRQVVEGTCEVCGTVLHRPLAVRV